MPLEPSKEAGNHGGQIHSHRFPAANTSLANANKDAEQVAVEQKFLTSGFISVDIFAASPVENAGKETAMIRRAATGPTPSSGSAGGGKTRAAGRYFHPRGRQGSRAPGPGAAEAQARLHCSRRCRRQDAENWTLLPGRHARFVRYLAGTSGHGCHRQSDLLEWPSGRWRQGP